MLLFFSRTRRRAAYHYIKKKKGGFRNPLQHHTHPNTSQDTIRLSLDKDLTPLVVGELTHWLALEQGDGKLLELRPDSRGEVRP
jgi:hypothetical protein